MFPFCEIQSSSNDNKKKKAPFHVGKNLFFFSFRLFFFSLLSLIQKKNMADNFSKTSKLIHTIRKVSLQHNPHLIIEKNKMVSDFLLSNDSVMSLKDNYRLPLVPALCKSTKHDILLKPSLKLHRNAPTLSKSVRFDMPLVQVLHFHTSNDIENYEEEENEDENEDEDEDEDFEDSEDDDYYAEEEENDLEDAFLEVFSKGLSSPYDTELSQYFTETSVKNKVCLELSNWPSVNPTDRLVSQMVSLESLTWENKLNVLKGRVLVRNIAFEKSVTIRLSFNHWKTWIDVEATHNKSSVDGALDLFTFELVTPSHLSYLNLINASSSCSMAVRYRVNGQEHWDNNDERNFNIQWTSDNGSLCTVGNMTEDTSALEKKIRSSFYPSTPLIQESQVLKKEEYPTCFLSCCTNTGIYIVPPCHDQPVYLPTQKQPDLHFQLYLNKNRHPQQRHGEISILDLNAIAAVSSPPLSPLLIPPGRNDLVIA